MLASDFFTDFDDPNPNPTRLLNPDGSQAVGASENDEGLCVRFPGRAILASAAVTVVVYDPAGNVNSAFTGLAAQLVRPGASAIVGFDFPSTPVLAAGDWYFRFRIVEGGRTWDSSLIWLTKAVN